MNWEQLCRPFNRGQLKTRQGRSNQQYLYVPSEVVISRILECTKDWDFVIKESKREGNEIIVVGSLRLETFGVREAFGAGVYDEKKGYANTYKQAGSLSLVKAASLWGMPTIFHTQTAAPQQEPTQQQSQTTACEDCNTIVDLKTYNYSRYNFQNHVYCRQCQPIHRNRA